MSLSNQSMSYASCSYYALPSIDYCQSRGSCYSSCFYYRSLCFPPQLITVSIGVPCKLRLFSVEPYPTVTCHSKLQPGAPGVGTGYDPETIDYPNCRSQSHYYCCCASDYFVVFMNWPEFLESLGCYLLKSYTTAISITSEMC